ncbi:hypothetical protein GCM10023209_07540 [Roseibacterium beibuensis]|uniref:Uncharacterized protein n=1 Tax=[Roseibacterium] beibuensis TaxID=1193142 RepID=A0ABP9L1A0_9RHOB
MSELISAPRAPQMERTNSGVAMTNQTVSGIIARCIAFSTVRRRGSRLRSALSGRGGGDVSVSVMGQSRATARESFGKKNPGNQGRRGRCPKM